MGSKLLLLGAAGAAVLGAVGAAGLAYNYFFDADAGAQRRKTSLAVVNGMIEKSGLGGMDKNLMATFMEKMATAK